MSVATLGGQSSSAPIGSTTLLTQGVSSTGLATYTPATPLPAGTYTLTASGATDGISATVNSVEKTSSKGNAVTFTASVPINSLEMKSTATPEFANLGKTVDLPTNSGAASEFRVIGENNGTYYGFNSGTYTTLYWTTDFYRFTSMTVPQFTSGASGTGETTPRFYKDPTGNLVIIGYTYTIKSTNGGTTWTQYTNGINGTYPISYNGSSIFVTNNGTNFLSSTDGITWTTRTAAAYGFSVIEWVNNQFVAATAAVVYTSPDGITWTQKTTTAGMSTTPTSIAYGASTYVFGNLSAVNNFYSTTLTGAFTVTSGILGAVTYVGTQFYVFSYNAGTYFTSTNGSTWNTYSMPNGFSQTPTWLAHNAANTEAIVTYGTNGLFKVNASYSIPQSLIASGSGSVVAYVKVGNTHYIYDTVSNIWITSDNGATWINRSWKPNATFGGATLFGVAYSGSTFYGVWGYPGTNQYLYYGSSPDGYTWTINSTAVYTAGGTVIASSYSYTSDNNNIYVYFLANGPTSNIVKISSAGVFLGNWTQAITNAAPGLTTNIINPQIMGNSIVVAYFNSSLSFAVVNLSTMTGLVVQTAGGTITLNSAYSMAYVGNVWIAINNGGGVYAGVWPDRLVQQQIALGTLQGTGFVAYGVYNNEFYVSIVSNATNNAMSTIVKSGNGTDWSFVGTFPNTAYPLAGYHNSGYSVRWRLTPGQYQVQYANTSTPTVFTLYATPVATYN